VSDRDKKEDAVGHLLERVRALIALASSPSLEEARTAAYKACELIRDEKLLVGVLTEEGILRTVGGPDRSDRPDRSSTSSASSPSTRSSSYPSSRASYRHNRHGSGGNGPDPYGGKSIGDVLRDVSFIDDLFAEAHRDISGEREKGRGHISPDGHTSLCGAPLLYVRAGYDQSSIQFVSLDSARRMRASQALKSLCPTCVQIYVRRYPT
jgi:hypothetical protein